MSYLPKIILAAREGERELQAYAQQQVSEVMRMFEIHCVAEARLRKAGCEYKVPAEIMARVRGSRYGREALTEAVVRVLCSQVTAAVANHAEVCVITDAHWEAICGSKRFIHEKRTVVHPGDEESMRTAQEQLLALDNLPRDALPYLYVQVTFPKLDFQEASCSATAASSLEQTCAVCLEQQPVVAMVPCGHVICIGCVDVLPRPRKCPVCRGAVAALQNLFSP